MCTPFVFAATQIVNFLGVFVSDRFFLLCSVLFFINNPYDKSLSFQLVCVLAYKIMVYVIFYMYLHLPFVCLPHGLDSRHFKSYGL